MSIEVEDGELAKLTGKRKAKKTGGAAEYPPRWVRIPTRGRCPETGFTRPAIYDLINAGKIKTACIRKPGTVRGQRFVYLPSLLALLDREAEREARRIEREAKAKKSEVDHASA